MLQALRCLAVLLLGLSLACLAGQPPQPPDAGGDNDMLKQVMEELKNTRLKPDGTGLSPVGKPHARLCEICNEPLYKHADPAFECIPKDADGRPRLVLKVRTQQVQCPVCNASFIGALRGNVNDHAGRDRDFCAHSVGKYSVQSNVWLCPECGYAALVERFSQGLDGKPLDESVKTFVREKLSATTRTRMIGVTGINARPDSPIPPDLLKFASYVLQTEIPDWMKYDNALQIYAQQKAPHVLLATLFLEGAHACRREINSEVAVPALHNSLQVSLGQSIRRANNLIQQEAMTIRRQRGEPIVDPTKAETEPEILTKAIAAVIRRGEEAPPPSAQAPNAAATDYIRTGDMYVAYIRYAGALDRMGYLDQAAKALEKAHKFIPERLPVMVDNQENKALTDYFTQQLQLLRSVPIGRTELLKREREYLFNSAKNNLAALKFKELKLKELGKPEAPAEKNVCEAAPTSYLLGEVFRRADALPEAVAWFQTAELVINKRLQLLDAAEKAKSMPQAELETQRDRYLTLKSWNDAQKALVKTKDSADDYVHGVIALVLASESITDSTPRVAPQPGPVKAAVNNPVGDPKPEVPATVSAVKTREQLYKLYYDALIRYRNDKKQNARALIELVKGGYLNAADAHLDEKGKLVCPESGERLGYSINWEPGDKSAPVLFPIKPGSKTLFASGEVREGIVSR